jgi:hypothetical protein
VTEAELQQEVIRLAGLSGHLVFHSGDPRRDTGRGFPDLVIAGMNSTLFAELKSATGNRTADQTRWHYRLIAAGANVVLWRPGDLHNGRIEAVLRDL